MFQNPFSFEGRIRRTELLQSCLFTMTCAIIVAVVVDRFGLGLLMMYILMIPAKWFLFAQLAKRCHDLGKSGWFQLIPFYGFWLLCAPGVQGVNKYGPNPKGVGFEETLETTN